ncbi:PLDc N-terminal domain-containing protein [Agromyces cerinus]|uniref:Phospholipase_D-nuclease N-terminal n=1 Tax=Agromyces cerinus subsp. cerinus TaxID=232089 RepID=A0A1N6EYY1_9MICO|nr:PLDc N-terminal domain-containing protein [Agromyces cerinus]SIN88220.1 Phospholipase_D-nuclease N-terminal [Agromyces cerinus subsp. cerinus]
MSFWDYLTVFFWVYVGIACLCIFVVLIVDIFRDHSLSGWAKAAWVAFLIVMPFVGSIVYLIMRGGGMSSRRGGDQPMLA